MNDGPAQPLPEDAAAPAGDTAAALPEELEDRAYEVLLELPAAERDAAFAALLAGHPEHRDALLRVHRALRGAEHALRDTGLAAAPPPTELGPYRLLRKLGEGGFGVVWLAEQRAPIQRRVALKWIRPGMDTAAVLRRFEAERELLGRFDHPSIARVLDAGITDTGDPYLVTEYVAGVPLTQYSGERRLGLEERLRLLLQVCDGVQHAHQRGVIHRDLKPSNVLVAEVDGEPRAKIIDFGIARALGGQNELGLTRAGTLLGTPEYMSPEQAEGSIDVDTRTDVYALGVMLFELLVGDLPQGRARWRKAGISELVDLIRRCEAPRPSTRVPDSTMARQLRGDLDWIVLTALQKDRERRYSNVAQLAADLRAFLAHRPVSVGAPSLGYQVRRFVRRNRLPVALGAIALTALVGALVSTLAAFRDTARAEAEARRHLEQFFGLADVMHLRELRTEAATAWPAVPERVPQYAAWLERAEALLARGEERRRVMAGAGAGGEAERFLRETLEQLETEIATFAGERGELRDVRQRLAFAQGVQRATVDDVAAAWSAAAAAVRADARFGGLQLAPQLGLVPLGADPLSGMQEFAVLQTGAAPARGEDGRLAIGDDSALVLVLLPGGTFSMGAQFDDPKQPRYELQPEIGLGGIQDVTLAPFFVGKHEMTRGQWIRVFGHDPSHYPIGEVTPNGPLRAMHPVENLSWEEAAAAMQRLGLELPTEAQWEYACRAGAATRWPWGDDVLVLQGAANIGGREATWMQPQGLKTTPELDDGFVFMAPIGSLAPNAFGLHDCIGNLIEWCRDVPARITIPVREGDGLRGAEPVPEREHVLRGGSYADPAMRATCTFRSVAFGSNKNSLAGIRPVRSLQPAR